MPRSSFALSDGGRVAAAMLALLAMLLVLPGSALAQEPGPEDTPPIITAASVSPRSLPYEGGQVLISADAIDDFGVTMFYADVFASGTSGESVQLIPFEIHPDGVTTFQGYVNIAPNHTDAPVVYGVVLQATDWNGGFDTEVAGDITVDAQPQVDEPPALSDATVNPRELGSGGGAVTIGVTATDAVGIASVSATVALSSGATATVALQPTGASRFEGVFTAPPNTVTVAVQHAIQITALDTAAQPASLDAGVVTVAAAPPVALGRLTLSPATRSFGQVQVGRTARQSIVLRNPGRRSSPAIRGTIAAPEAPFYLVGAGTQGIAFSLRGGESKRFLVEFRPTSTGDYQAAAAIQRADGGQPELALRLSGRGARRR